MLNKEQIIALYLAFIEAFDLKNSDVFCEHRDAEVHPLCEVCPSCGENIS